MVVTASLTKMTRGRILFVDDGDLFRTALTRLLSVRYQVDVFASSTEALECFVPGRYCIGVIDLNMPGLTGDQLVIRLRQIDPRICTVLFTGCELDKNDLRLTHFDFYVNKPNFDQLYKLIVIVSAASNTSTDSPADNLSESTMA